MTAEFDAIINILPQRLFIILSSRLEYLLSVATVDACLPCPLNQLLQEVLI